MTKPIIHFAHANGFPARVYSKLFSLLEDSFDVNFLVRHAHDPNFPVNDNWTNLRDELIAELELHYTKPIIGVGHSLGGILHFLAAAEKPEFYSRIILLDAPIISRISSKGIHILKMTRLIDRLPLTSITRTRRNIWDSKQAALDHFAKKKKFAAFDKDVLRDYVNFGTVKTENGVELYYTPEIEAEIYRTLPHSLPRIAKSVNIPINYIGGSTSYEGKLAGLSLMKNHEAFELTEVEGSHLFPLENPTGTARKIKETLKNT